MKVKISILTLSLITFLIGMRFDFTSVELDNTGENFNLVFCSENSNYSEKQNKDMLFSEQSFDNEYISCIDSEKKINGATETYHFMTKCKIDTILS